MDTKKKETRIIGGEAADVRAAKDSRMIEGYGIVFNKLSKEIYGFREKIVPEAIDGVLEESDIVSVLNHDIGKGVLARSKQGEGSLNLDVDTKGVKYSFDAPKFSLGDEVLEGIRRGDIRGSSFAFTVKDDHWEEQEDGTYIRTILKFDRIYDISPVYEGAYEDTTVALRSLEEVRGKTVDTPEGDDKPPAGKAADDKLTEPEEVPADYFNSYDQVVKELE